jgi:hypothetical protein
MMVMWISAVFVHGTHSEQKNIEIYSFVSFFLFVLIHNIVLFIEYTIRFNCLFFCWLTFGEFDTPLRVPFLGMS